MRRLHKWLLPLAVLFKLPVSPLFGKACVLGSGKPAQTRLVRLGFGFEIHCKCTMPITVI